MFVFEHHASSHGRRLPDGQLAYGLRLEYRGAAHRVAHRHSVGLLVCREGKLAIVLAGLEPPVLRKVVATYAAPTQRETRARGAAVKRYRYQLS